MVQWHSPSIGASNESDILGDRSQRFAHGKMVIGRKAPQAVRNGYFNGVNQEQEPTKTRHHYPHSVKQDCIPPFEAHKVVVHTESGSRMFSDET